jgi:hypothetical protein
MKTLLGRILREPLLHFFAIGAGLFGLFAVLRGPVAGDPARIHVDRARIAQLAGGFERTWQRPPTREELAGLVDDFVREEILYREAIALGLDRDDLIVRRRMRQKIEFLSADVAPVAEPDDAALARHLDRHADAYRIEPRVSLRQVLLSRDRRGDAAPADAQALLARLAADPDAEALGDPSLLPASLPLVPLRDVAREFGEGFAAAVAQLEPGRWSGPVESSFGLHLVFVEAREAGRAPALAEVRDAVRSDWIAARRSEADEAFYRGLRERYEVTIDRLDEPEAAAPSTAVGANR